MIDPEQNTAVPGRKLIRFAITAAWIVAALLVWQNESARLGDLPDGQSSWLAIVTAPDMDTTLFIPLLLVAPLFWWGAIRNGESEVPSSGRRRTSVVGALLVSVLVGCAAFVSSTSVAEMNARPNAEGDRFGQLPPAYHDEYAYLFQAQTFLAGRTVFPSQGPDGLFDQMHVLNQDQFASRYFPAAGLYMAPFVAAGKPYLGHQIANGLIAALLCFLTCRAGGLAAGVIAGACLAMAPGMAIFSNLLLAHHPALLGLSVFLVTILEARHRAPLILGSIAGVGLTFAMLSRPMTAAGIALPFGVWVLYRLLRPTDARKQFVRISIGLGLPIVGGFVTLAVYNQSVTGDLLTTPYSVYTNTYTPNHVYGFDNVVRGNEVETEKRIAKYDGWAENLTPSVAVRNAKNRVRASFVWTLGLIPNAMLAVVCLVLWPRLQFEARMLLASILSLYLLHVPYWFDGIMHYHYVFESGALWCVLAGLVVVTLARALSFRVLSRPSIWIAACLLVALGVNYVQLPNPFVADTDMFPASRIQAEVTGISFSRLRYAKFRELLQDVKKPALVLVQHDPADIHIEYVNNHPSLNADIVIGHADAYRRSSDAEDSAVLSGRTVYLYDVKRSPGKLLPFTDR